MAKAIRGSVKLSEGMAAKNAAPPGKLPLVLEEAPIISKSAIVVDTKPQFKQVSIPNGMIAYKSVDSKGNEFEGLVNEKGLHDMINYHTANNIPFSYDEKKNQSHSQ